jgi:hypothetical protein
MQLGLEVELLRICYEWPIACSLVSFRVALVLVVTHVTTAHNYVKEQPCILPL